MLIRVIFRGIFCGMSAPPVAVRGKSWRNQQSQPSVSSNLEYLSRISSNNDYQWLPAEGLSAHFITAAPHYCECCSVLAGKCQGKKTRESSLAVKLRPTALFLASISNFPYNLHSYDADCVMWWSRCVPAIERLLETRRPSTVYPMIIAAVLAAEERKSNKLKRMIPFFDD